MPPKHTVTCASCLTTIIGDIGVANQIFATGADRAGADLVVAEFFADCLFGLKGALAKQIGRVIKLDAVVVDKQLGPPITAVVQHHAVPTRAFKRDGEPTAREAVTNKTGKG